nr:ABC transporter permease [uncultured Bacteroides sp.]
MKTFKYAVRFLLRSKSYTVINLLGLALSLACCIILLRYIHRELTVDIHCVDREQVYGVITNMEGNQGLGTIEGTIKDSVYLDHRYIEQRATVILLEDDFVTSGENRYPVRVLATDSCFLRLFPYRIVQGTDIQSPSSALLTQSYARHLFGNENPVGKVLRHSTGKDITVCGILAEPDNKTLLKFDLLISVSFSRFWGRMPMEFIRFVPGTDLDKMNEIGKQPRWVNPRWKDADGRQYTFSFLPVKDIYWRPEYVQNTEVPTMTTYGNRQHLYILSGVCLLLLLTGLINFINMYLVCLQKRGKEYGLRKVFGAKGKELFLQILAENALLVLVAILLAWLFIEITNVPVNGLLEYPFSYESFDLWLSLGLFIGLPLLTSIYPFMKYNYAMPIVSIRDINLTRRSVNTRMVFLLVQYIFTFLLTVLSLYFNKQLLLVLHTDPGFRTENILIAKLGYEPDNPASREERQAGRQRMRELGDALKQCSLIEHFEGDRRHILSEGFNVVYRNSKEEKVNLKFWYASPEFFKVYDIKVLEGKIPDYENASERREVLVANRSAMKALGYKDLSEAFVVEDNDRRIKDNAPMEPIVAVVEDYYDRHVAFGKRPIIYKISGYGSGMYQIAYTPGRLKELLSYLQELEIRIYGTSDFEYTLLEDEVRKLYKADRQVSIVYSVFALIAVVISCIGLFGISLFDIRQRYREIAIRKVNGASTRELYRVLFGKYMFILGVAFIVAIPLSSYFIYMYTRDFMIKASAGVGIYIISLLLVVSISLGTLFWQIHKAAKINPAEVIKSE